MRKIITTTFMTLDGVYQAPGGPEEDRTDGFQWGGWSFHYWDELGGKIMGEFMAEPFDLLLGRRTYDIFAAYWPQNTSEPMVAEPFNKATKYVVSRRSIPLTWENSVLVSGDVVAELKMIKRQSGKDIWVHGSGNLIQTLLANGLVDRMHIWTCPVTVGRGKRLFGDNTPAQGLKMSDCKITSTGVTIATYEPAGILKTGSFATEQPGTVVQTD